MYHNNWNINKYDINYQIQYHKLFIVATKQNIQKKSPEVILLWYVDYFDLRSTEVLPATKNFVSLNYVE